MIEITHPDNNQKAAARAVLLSSTEGRGLITAQQAEIISKFRTSDQGCVPFFAPDESTYIQWIKPHEEDYKNLEAARQAGAVLSKQLKKAAIINVSLSTDGNAALLLAYAEGLALGSYTFDKYKKEKPEATLDQIFLQSPSPKDTQIAQLNAVIEGNFYARDLVNEPGNYLTAEKFSEKIALLGKKIGFQTEIFNKARIESLRMGGLLGVNAGSHQPPTFSILEYKPHKPINAQPFVFVGKGVTFDTGGLSLKSTANSMDLMKSDMAGAAAVVGLFYAATRMKFPIHIVGLIPATDNRPGNNAIFPSDILQMYSGTTVEVMNTDAEGRLILADALAYAKKFNPQLVIDLATLTGAAVKAIGPYGIVYMSTADESVNKALEKSGRYTYERLVNLPLWGEYGELLKSNVADLKNVPSGGVAGAITAGKFLQHFTDFPWVHLDIAPTAFLTTPDSYRGKDATGVGVRLLFDFLMEKLQLNER